MAQTKSITIEVEGDTFRALIRQATKLGMHPSDFASLTLIRGLKTYGSNPDADIEVRLWAMQQNVSSKREAWSALVYIANYYLSSPEEEVLDELEHLAGEYGFEIRDILHEAGKTEPKILAAIQGDNAVSKAARWLSDVMIPGKSYLVSDIRQMAQADDVSSWALKTAKAKLEVQSIRAGKNWTWVMPIPVMEEVDHDISG